MRAVDLFSGIYGAGLAMERAGIEVVAHAEIEPFCCRLLEHRRPGIPNYGDVSKIDPEEIVENHEPIDLVSFGSPCQDWSVAGKRLGLKGHRSSLFHEAIRIIRLCRPRFAVFENVPGLFSAAGGWDFVSVLDEMAESGALDIAWRVLDAQWFGVPQRRRRIFLVADFGGERAAEILSISEGVFRHPTPGGEAGQEAASGTRSCSQVACGVDSRSNYHSDHDGDESRLIPEVSFAFIANERWEGESETFIPEPLAFSWREDDSGADGRSYAPPIGTLDDTAVAFAENQRGEIRTSETHPQSTAGGGKPGQGYPAVAFTERTRSDGRNFEYQVDQAYALTNPGSGGRTHSRQLIQGMAVRRLTPKECERLQGFPDDWTNMPGASDSARYRALGNAWAVPVGEWVMKRIAESFGA